LVLPGIFSYFDTPKTNSMKLPQIGYRYFWISVIVLSISGFLVSCEKDDDKVNVPYSGNVNVATGVLEVHYGKNEAHRITVASNNDTITKDSPLGMMVDTLQLSPGNYDVFVGQLLSQQGPGQGISDDFFVIINSNNTTVISVPF
jgi:hypothetical protein